MSLKAELKDRKFFAIINFASESVINNSCAIFDALDRFSKRYGVHVDTSFESDNINNNWTEIDRQFSIAKHYSDILVFGGDGTQTHILNKVVQEKLNINFIGIATGTMNINTFSNSLSELEYIFDVPSTIWLDAICCQVNMDRYLCFIDAVITTTCVSRINGIISQASAEGLLLGHKFRAVPESIGNKDTSVIVNYYKGTKVLPSLDKVFTISCAFLRDGLKAQVLAGGADPSACAGFSWGIIISDFPLVWADVTKQDLQAHSPITSRFYPLMPSDSVKINYLSEAAHLVIDGNVICKTDSLIISYRKKICKVIKYGGNQ